MLLQPKIVTTYLVPVVCHLLEAHSLTDVAEVEDVLLEAGATKANTGVQELATNARVGTNGVCNLQGAV